MGTTEPPDPLADPRVFRAVQEYQADLDAGRVPDRAGLLARYPDVADPLAGCLRALDLLRSVARRVGPTEGVPADPSAGVPRLGDFRIVREVGRGGMGIVYEAEQLSLGRRVALKVLPAVVALDPRQLGRFQTEARAAAQLRHPHVVPVHTVGAEGGVHFLAMDFIAGDTLAAEIDRLRRAGRPGSPTATAGPDVTPGPGRGAGPDAPPAPPPAWAAGDRYRAAARLGAGAAEALAHAHAAGVIHRDVKPGNLLVEPTGHVWVADFGLARLVGAGDLTRAGELVGTLRYMSPEQARGGGPLDFRTDVYSLGVTLYELLALRPAFPGSDPQDVLRRIAAEDPPALRRLDPAVPRDLDTVVRKAMAKDPGDRYATAADLAADLHRFLDGRPVRARPVGRARRAAKWVRRNPKPAGLLATIFVVLLAGLAATTWQWRAADGQRRRAEALTETLGRRARDLAEANDRVERGRVHARAERWAAARADFDRALAVLPDHGTALGERAEMYARLGLWDRAAPDARAAAAATTPDGLDADFPVWFRLGALAARTGDRAEYQRVCREAARPDRLAAAGPLARWWVGRLCCLAPDALPDPEQVVAIVRAAGDELTHPVEPAGGRTTGLEPAASVRTRVLATALVRAGRPEEARRLLTAFSSPALAPTDVPLTDLIVARTYHDPDRAPAAGPLSAQVGRWLDGVVFGDWRKPAPPRPLETWIDWAEFEGLYDEAVGLGLARRVPARDHTRRARALAAVGDWPAAEAELAPALAADPADARPLLALVREPTFVRDWARAADLLTRATARAPTNYLVWSELFKARGRVGDLAGADAALARWAALRPADPYVRRDAFQVFADAGDWSRARAELDKVAPLAPADLSARFEGFRYLADRGRWPEAYAERDRVLAADPANVALSFQVGLYFWDRDDHRRGRPEWFRTVLMRPFERREENFFGWFNLGTGAYRLGEWELARVAYRFAAWYRDADSDIHACVGRTELRLGNWAAAAEGFGRAVARAPGGPRAHDFRRDQATCYVMAGMLPEYRRTCADFLAQFSGPAASRAQPVAMLLWACILHPDGWVDGPRLLRLAEQIRPETQSSGGTALYGRCLYRDGRFEEARRVLRATAAGDWEHVGDYCFLALAEVRLGQTAAATAYLGKLPTNLWYAQQRSENWQNQVFFGLTRREAEAALGVPLTPVRVGP